MWKNALEPIIKPAVETGNIKDKVQVLIRLQVQPWYVYVQSYYHLARFSASLSRHTDAPIVRTTNRHGSSLFTHEAALAVGLVAPESFWAFATLVSALCYLSAIHFC